MVQMEVTDNDGVNVFRQGFVNSDEVEIGKSTVILENCQCIHGIIFLTSAWHLLGKMLILDKSCFRVPPRLAYFGKTFSKRNAFESVPQICDDFSFRDQT